MRRVFCLPQSSTDLSTPALREAMRRHHWRSYFLALRQVESIYRGDPARLNSPERKKADYHRALAQSLQQKLEPHR